MQQCQNHPTADIRWLEQQFWQLVLQCVLCNLLQSISAAVLLQEWAAQQEAIRNEPLDIVYSYWDGAGHRRKVSSWGITDVECPRRDCSARDVSKE